MASERHRPQRSLDSFRDTSDSAASGKAGFTNATRRGEPHEPPQATVVGCRFLAEEFRTKSSQICTLKILNFASELFRSPFLTMARVSLLCLVEFVSLALGFFELDRSQMELRNISQLQDSLPNAVIRQSVTLLDVSDNYLVQLSGDWDLPNLTYLDAASNEITDVDSDFLCYYPRLTRLDLSANRLAHFPAPSNMPESLLRHLDLSYNRFERIGATVLREYPLLENLSLAGNNLTDTSGLLALKSSLVRLDLDSANLYDVDFNVSEFTSLKYLNLANNSLGSILVCGSGGVLVELNLARNRFHRIPDLSCMGGTLTGLEMAWNWLPTLGDPDLRNLTALRYLDVSHNELASVELCLDRSANGLNSSLEDLFADGNRLAGNKTVVGCAAVYVLTLTSNPLVEWPGVDSMTSLERIDLSGTQLATAPPSGVLHRLVRVNELTLKNNLLAWTDVSDVVMTAVNLKMIDLLGNRLQEIQPFPVCDSSLEKIILAQNKITCLPEITCGNMSSVNVTIDLRSNPLSCDCCMAWLKQHEYDLRTELTVNKDPIYCTRDRSTSMWDDIKPDYFSYCTATSTSLPEEAKSTTTDYVFSELNSGRYPDVSISTVATTSTTTTTTTTTLTTTETQETATFQQMVEPSAINTASAAPSTQYTTTTDALTTADYGFVLNWNQWTEWSECTKSCGGGSRMRLLLCPDGASNNCTFILEHEELPQAVGYKYEQNTCSDSPCPVDGVWLSWQPWSECSATCGQGTNQRQRLCSGPLYDGKPCEGVDREFMTCFIEACTESRASFSRRKRELLPEVIYTEADERVSSIGVGTVATLVMAGVVLVVFGLDFQAMKSHVMNGVRKTSARRG